MIAALILSLLVVTGPPRTADEQTRLTALATALGRAHALHRLCTGASDDLWRSRVGKVLEVEKPDPVLKQRLVDAFNAGFAGANTDFTACWQESREALAEAERDAAGQARRLAKP